MGGRRGGGVGIEGWKAGKGKGRRGGRDVVGCGTVY